jgi:hypothetical protein
MPDEGRDYEYRSERANLGHYLRLRVSDIIIASSVKTGLSCCGRLRQRDDRDHDESQ